MTTTERCPYVFPCRCRCNREAGAYHPRDHAHAMNRMADAASGCTRAVRQPDARALAVLEVDALPALRPKCPDGGKCHHACDPDGACFRVLTCSPLTIAGWGDDWPAHIDKWNRRVHRRALAAADAARMPLVWEGDQG